MITVNGEYLKQIIYFYGILYHFQEKELEKELDR